MKGKRIRHIITSLFCWILLLQLINLSINPADFREFRSTNTSQIVSFPFNEIETLYELVAESVFDENIPDSEDKDTESSFKSFDLLNFPARQNGMMLMPYTVTYFSFYQPVTSLVRAESIAPPPKYA